jgi:hypothetical protein
MQGAWHLLLVQRLFQEQRVVCIRRNLSALRLALLQGIQWTLSIGALEHLHQRVPKSEVQPIGFWTADRRPTIFPKIQLIGTWTWTAGSRVLKSLHLELFLPRL